MAYKRKTSDEWVVQGNYGYGYGWVDVNTELSRKDGRRSLKEYDENEPAPHRLIKRRVPINE